MGQIIGAILSGGIVAYFSFYLGSKTQNKKDKNIYTGNLFSLLVELQWTEGIIDRTIKELNTIKQQSIEKSDFITGGIPTILPVDNLCSLRDNLVTYDKVDGQILLLTNIIVNLSLEINLSLDFSRPIKYLEENKDGNTQDAIGGYFDTLIDDYFKKLSLAIENLEREVRTEIERQPEAKVLEKYNITK